ncbi:unnamed protein product [Hapterophycus canaliculatus]
MCGRRTRASTQEVPRGAGIPGFLRRRLCLVRTGASSWCSSQTEDDVDWLVAGGRCSPSACLRDSERCVWSNSPSARLRLYADSQLNVTADVKNVFQYAFNQGRVQMAGVVRVAEAEDRYLIVLVNWVRFEVDQRTWVHCHGALETQKSINFRGEEGTREVQRYTICSELSVIICDHLFGEYAGFVIYR